MREESRVLYEKSLIAYEEILKKRKLKELQKASNEPISKRNPVKVDSESIAPDIYPELNSESLLLSEFTEIEKKYIVSVFRNRCTY